MASRRELCRREIWFGVREFYDGVRISLPFGEFRVVVDFEQYPNRRGWAAADNKPPMARCWNVGQRKIPSGMFERNYAKFIYISRTVCCGCHGSTAKRNCDHIWGRLDATRRGYRR